MSESLLHPNCNGSHPGKEAREGEYTWDQCRLCWMALNEPERVRALIEGRPAAVEAAKPAALVTTRWPWRMWLLWAVRHRQDSGTGDTLARRLGVAGDAWKAAYKRWAGKDCGCGDRQRRMNTEYPYRPGWRWLRWWLPV